jgi:hypothetical protein
VTNEAELFSWLVAIVIPTVTLAVVLRAPELAVMIAICAVVVFPPPIERKPAQEPKLAMTEQREADRKEREADRGRHDEELGRQPPAFADGTPARWPDGSPRTAKNSEGNAMTTFLCYLFVLGVGATAGSLITMLRTLPVQYRILRKDERYFAEGRKRPLPWDKVEGQHGMGFDSAEEVEAWLGRRQQRKTLDEGPVEVVKEFSADELKSRGER